jgi:hypothetical protein
MCFEGQPKPPMIRNMCDMLQVVVIRYCPKDVETKSQELKRVEFYLLWILRASTTFNITAVVIAQNLEIYSEKIMKGLSNPTTKLPRN